MNTLILPKRDYEETNAGQSESHYQPYGFKGTDVMSHLLNTTGRTVREEVNHTIGAIKEIVTMNMDMMTEEQRKDLQAILNA